MSAHVVSTAIYPGSFDPITRGHEDIVRRALMFVDTLHPVHEGRLVRWGYGTTEQPLVEYGRTDLDALAASGANSHDVQAADRWRRGPFYRMLQTGDSVLRRRLDGTTKPNFQGLALSGVGKARNCWVLCRHFILWC